MPRRLRGLLRDFERGDTAARTELLLLACFPRVMARCPVRSDAVRYSRGA